MSIFLNGYQGVTSGGVVDEEKLKKAEIQFDAMSTTFNNILSTCMEKCISHDQYSENDLTKGEMSCVDRCVKKMHYTNRLIGGYMQSKGVTPETLLPEVTAVKIPFPSRPPDSFDHGQPPSS